VGQEWFLWGGGIGTAEFINKFHVCTWEANFSIIKEVKEGA
jgi:hypothetical protein